MSTPTQLHWSNHTRSDRLRVCLTLEATWIILPADDRHAIDRCPCCGRPFATSEAAMTVADKAYPLGGPVVPWKWPG